MKYCPNCKRNVNTEGRVNWIIAIVLLIFLFIPGVIYIIWGLVKRRCPICRTQDGMLEAPRFDEETRMP